MSVAFSVGLLAPRDRLDVQAFYRSVGYVAPLEPDAVCFGATGPHDRLLGVVRLVHEHGVLVLRGMQVRPDVQRLLLEPIAYANGSTLDDPAITFGIVFSNFMSKGVFIFQGGKIGRAHV